MQAIGETTVNDNNPYGVKTTSGRSNQTSGSPPGKKIKIQRYLTPDIVEVSGRRLPKEVAEYALANDLTEEQLDEYEAALIEQEKQDELEYHRRVTGMKLRYGQEGGLLNSLRKSNGGGDEENQHHVEVFDFIEDKKLNLPSRPSRLAYFNFQQGALTGRNMIPNSSPRLKTLSPRSLFGRLWSSGKNNFKSGGSSVGSPYTISAPQHDDDVYSNRHLKTTMTETRPLSQSDLELLRCIGLDTFVMIRFLRFCFDVTFYPFLLASMVLIPTYYTNNHNGIEFGEDLIIETQTDGYFRFTMNRLGMYIYGTCTYLLN